MRRRPCPRLKAALARFARAERGATAVEFGLIALPIMVMLFGVIELALVFLVSATLETAVESSARKIRTGEFQQGAATTRDDFKALVCDDMSWLGSDCAENLYVEAESFGTFAALADDAPTPADELEDGGGCWAVGKPTDIVLVRTYYRWRLFTPLLDASLENMGAGSGLRLVSSATAFRNEPYSDDPPEGQGC